MIPRFLAAIALARALVLPAIGQVRFEVASIHPSGPGASPQNARVMFSGDSFDAQNSTVGDILDMLNGWQLHRVVGGPAWMTTDRFDIHAKADGPIPKEEQHDRLMALLADRFQLTVHKETRDVAAMVLSVSAKSGGIIDRALIAHARRPVAHKERLARPKLRIPKRRHERMPASLCSPGALQTVGPECPTAHPGGDGLSRTYRKVSRLFNRVIPLGPFRHHRIDTADYTGFSTAWCDSAVVSGLIQTLSQGPIDSAQVGWHPQGQAERSDRGGALAITEPSSNRPGSNFRGMWVQGKPGARFEKKRLTNQSAA